MSEDKGRGNAELVQLIKDDPEWFVDPFLTDDEMIEALERGMWRPIEELTDPEREVLLFFPAIPAFKSAPGTPAVRKFGPLSKFARKASHFLDPGEPS